MIHPNSSHKFLVWVSVAMMVLGSSGWAQEPPETQQTPEELSSLSYAMQVELSQVVVRVVDNKGKWVGGLQKSDLQLFEDGVAQEIEYLDEIVESPQQTEPQPPKPKQERKGFVVASVTPNSIILIFDTSNTGQLGIQKHKDYVKNFLRDFNVPSTMFSLFVIEPTGSFELVQNFTEDKNRLIAEINNIRGSSSGIEAKTLKASQLADVDSIQQCSASQSLMNQCIDNVLTTIINQATAFAQEERNRSKNTIKSLQQIFQLAQHVPGQKSIILVSEGFDPLGAFYYNYAANVIRYFIDHFGLPNRYNSKVSEVQAEASRTTGDIHLVRDLAREANAAGIAVYWANPEYGKDVTDTSAELKEVTSFNLKLVNAPDTEMTMRGLADDTGGAALSSTDMAGFYKRLSENIPRYYLVSYKPKRAINDGQFHRIEVRAKNKDYKVIYGKDFKDEKLPDRIVNELAGAHDFPQFSASSPLSLEIQSFLKPTGEYQVMIHSGLPYEDIQPQMIENRVVDDIHFSFLVRDEQGNVIFDTHPILKIRSPLQEFQTLKDSKAVLEYVQNYSLKPGAYFVSVAGMDVTGWKTSSGSSRVSLPGSARSCVTISPAMLASRVTKMDSTTSEPKPNEKGEIQYGPNLFSFSMRRVFAPSGNLAGFYQIYNAREDLMTGNLSVGISFALYRDKTVLVNQTPERVISGYTDPLQKLIANFYSVPYKNLAPGSYELEIVVRDRSNGCHDSTRASFEISNPAAAAASN